MPQRTSSSDRFFCFPFFSSSRRRVFPFTGETEHKKNISYENTTNTITSSEKPDINISELYLWMKPRNKQNHYDIVASCYQLLLITKTFTYLDTISSTNEQDQLAYEQTKAVILAIKLINHDIISLPKPNDSSSYDRYVKQIYEYWNDIKAQMHLLNHQSLPCIEGIKSQLLAQYYVAYLEILSRSYLFDSGGKKIKNFFHDNIATIRKESQNMLRLLKADIQKRTFSTSKHLGLKEIIEFLEMSERRLRNRPPKSAQYQMDRLASLWNNDTEEHVLSATDEAIKTLESLSLEILFYVVKYPEKYFSLLNNEQKNELLLDLLFSADPYSYMLVMQTDSEFKTFKKSYAFEDSTVSAYFNTDIEERSLKQKDMLEKITVRLENAENTDKLIYAVEQNNTNDIFLVQDDLSDISEDICQSPSISYINLFKQPPKILDFPVISNDSSVQSTHK